jgi:hypothetical protein
VQRTDRNLKQKRHAILIALALACLACGLVLSVLGDGIYWNRENSMASCYGDGQLRLEERP